MFMLILSLVVGGIFFLLQKKLLGPAAKLCVFSVIIILVASNPVGLTFLTSCLLLVIGGCVVSSLVRIFRYGKQLPAAYKEQMVTRKTSGLRVVLRVLWFCICFLFKGLFLTCRFVFKVLWSVVTFVTDRWSH